MSRIERYLELLNEAQREAVLENSRPLLVLAGAGSGKTRVITTKIAYAIEVLGFPVDRILAVTFTNKAAHEMHSRVTDMLKEVDVSAMQIRTFHSFGAWLLRRYGKRIGLDPSFAIYDDEDSLRLLAVCFPKYRRAELAGIAHAIALAKDRGMRPDSPELADFRSDDQFPRQFEIYEKTLHKSGNVDFADLIGRSIELLAFHEDIAASIRRQFGMILVDEYQDSNIAQFNLLKNLVAPETFVCVVGDDDQSIYRFRGAEVRNILSFPEVYPNTRIITLEQNYRSTSTILEIADSVISRNKGRHPKTLWTENGRGPLCHLTQLPNEKVEASYVADILKSTGDYEHSAVLYRTNAQSQAFETLFSRMGIPYTVVGALRFYDREEIKDALAMLFLLLNRNDEVHFRRMVNKPARGLGDVSVEKVVELARMRNIDLISALRLAAQEHLVQGKAAKGAQKFVALFDGAYERLAQSNAACLEYMIVQSSLLEQYKNEDEQNGTDRVENLGTLLSAVGDYPAGYEGLSLFLESLTLDPTTIGTHEPSEERGVSLITMHNTKGLEFDRVFITGLEEGIFPGRSCESIEDIEEERRIFYVAITRARRELYLSNCRMRTLWGSAHIQVPSRFLSDIPPHLVQRERIEMPVYSALDVKRMLARGTVRSVNKNSISVPEKKSGDEDKRLFVLGDRVYHDAFGEGEVQNIRTAGGRQLVDVLFATGKAATFFSSAPALEKVDGT